MDKEGHKDFHILIEEKENEVIEVENWKKFNTDMSEEGCSCALI